MKYDNHVPWGHSRPRSRISQWCEYHDIAITWAGVRGFIIGVLIILWLAGAEGSLFVR